MTTAERCGGTKIAEVAGARGKPISVNCPGCEDCQPPASEVARREQAAARHAEVMASPERRVEAHRVQHGDAILGVDGEWRPVLAAFAENAASASPTLWVVLCHVDGSPTRRVTFDPGTEVTIRRKA